MFKLKCDDFLTYDEATGTYSVSPDQQVRDEVEKTRWKDIVFKILTDWRLYLMLVPMLFVYFFWRYMPMTELVAVFKDYFSNTSDPAAGNWYGLENFIYVYFNGGEQITQEFWMSFRNTFILAFYGLLFGFPFPIILALFFNEIRSNIVRSVAQVCVYLPKFMSIVVISTLAITLFGTNSETGAQGVVAQLLVKICGENSSLGQAAANITQEGSGLIYSARYFRAIYIITDLWEHAGYDSIVFFAAIIAVSPTSYEAAQIDGAGKMQQMRYVVIPSILSTVVIMLIMKIGSLLNVSYEKIFLFSTSGGAEAAPMANYQSAYVVSVWANSQSNTVAAMAGEMTNNLIGMILVIGANIVSRKATDVSLY